MTGVLTLDAMMGRSESSDLRDIVEFEKSLDVVEASLSSCS